MADQIHRDLPDTELHEPKGFASSSTNEVPINDGTTTTWKLVDNANVAPGAGLESSKLADYPWGKEDFQTGSDEGDWVAEATDLDVSYSQVFQHDFVNTTAISATASDTSYETYTYHINTARSRSQALSCTGTVRFTYDFTTTVASQTASTRILLDGVEVNEFTRTTDGTTNVIQQVENVNPGSVITVQIKDAGGSSAGGSATNFVVHADKPGILRTYTLQT